MSKGFQNILAGGGICALFVFQIAVSASLYPVLFFPASVLYVATYMTAPFALVFGVFVGGVWGSASLLPLIIHALVWGGSMGGASVCMRSFDERKAGAHGFVACIVWMIYIFIFGVAYMWEGREIHQLTLLGYDALAGFFTLMAMTFCHMLLLRACSKSNR